MLITFRTYNINKKDQTVDQIHVVYREDLSLNNATALRKLRVKYPYGQDKEYDLVQDGVKIMNTDPYDPLRKELLNEYRVEMMKGSVQSDMARNGFKGILNMDSSELMVEVKKFGLDVEKFKL